MNRTTDTDWRRAMRGHTLAELSISMGVAGLLATGFFHAYGSINSEIIQEITVSQYQDTVREALYQIGKDIRLAGANPTGNISLFDGEPETDIAVDIDPDQDGDLTNAILVRGDRYGTPDGEADGDAEDTLETVMYHYDASSAKLMRHTWRVPFDQSGTEIVDHESNQADYDVSPFVEGICSIGFTYYDRFDNPTEVANDVASVLVELTSASGPEECFSTNSFTRTSHAIIRIRNR